MLTLLIVGDGTQRQELTELSRVLGLEDTVKFLGTRHDAVEIVGSSDVFVHPTQLEGLGMAIMEAMSLGVPPVASRVPAIAELIEDGSSGVLVAPGDVAAWEEALLRLLRSPALRQEIGQAARGRAVSEFDPELWMDRTEAVYRSAQEARRLGRVLAR